VTNTPACLWFHFNPDIGICNIILFKEFSGVLTGIDKLDQTCLVIEQCPLSRVSEFLPELLKLSLGVRGGDPVRDINTSQGIGTVDAFRIVKIH